MQENQVSRTALTSAYSRGYHAVHASPKVFDDHLAFDILTEEERAGFDKSLLATLDMFIPGGASSFPGTETALSWMMQVSAGPPLVLARSRYTEECLEEAIKMGTTQYVILGAGLDTFAFRRTDLMKELELFEVDHPATQDHKRNRLTELKWKTPDNLHFVPVDFSRQSLAEALAASAYNPEASTFFSWLGVTYYLTREVVMTTLHTIANIAPKGSRVVFDYLDNDAFIPNKAVPRTFGMLQFTKQIGEPMQTGFDPLSLAAELAPCGVRLIEDLSPIDAYMRYFMGRTDHYRACEHAHIACVVVE